MQLRTGLVLAVTQRANRMQLHAGALGFAACRLAPLRVVLRYGQDVVSMLLFGMASAMSPAVTSGLIASRRRDSAVSL